MRWVNSEGGPLIFLPENSVSQWKGVVGEGGGRSDYDRACSIDGYLGLVGVDGDDGLVLNDEPLQTTWLGPAGRHSGMFVRWRYAKNEGSLLLHAHNAPESAFELPEIVLTMMSAECFLFDAALPGVGLSKEDYLGISLSPGQYRVQSASIVPDAETALILHRFVAAK